MPGTRGQALVEPDKRIVQLPVETFWTGRRRSRGREVEQLPVRLSLTAPWRGGAADIGFQLEGQRPELRQSTDPV